MQVCLTEDVLEWIPLSVDLENGLRYGKVRDWHCHLM